MFGNVPAFGTINEIRYVFHAVIAITSELDVFAPVAAMKRLDDGSGERSGKTLFLEPLDDMLKSGSHFAAIRRGGEQGGHDTC